MNQQPDNLFRQKLASHEIPVPATAWEKVEGNIHRTKRSRVWLKIAASLTLFVAASVVFFSNRWSTNTTLSVQVETGPEKKIPDPKNQQAGSRATPAISPSADTLPVVKTPKRSALPSTPTDVKKTVALDHADTLTRDEQTIPKIEILLEVIVADAVTESPVASDRPNNTSPESHDTPERVTLVYSTEDVEKYFNRTVNTDATAGDEKSSTLKKLLARAYDLKNDQDAYGELRQKKNEIFAFNLRGDRQRSENK